VVGDNQVVVSCPEVAAPTAVRYAWADNPVCNLFSSDDLPVTPFRSDTPATLMEAVRSSQGTGSSLDTKKQP